MEAEGVPYTLIKPNGSAVIATCRTAVRPGHLIVAEGETYEVVRVAMPARAPRPILFVVPSG